MNLQEKQLDEQVDEKLISKKDLLKLAGISYGQLYRWKRKSIIPEDWFIRKSTFTGQETFFPRKEILERVDKVQQMKDSLSLDELAEIFSGAESEVTMSGMSLVTDSIISEVAHKFYKENYKEVNEPKFHEALQMYVVDELLNSGDFSQDEVRMFLELVSNHEQEFEKTSGEIIFTRKLGVSNCMLLSEPTKIFIEKNTKIVKTISLSSRSESLKTKIMRGSSNG